MSFSSHLHILPSILLPRCTFPRNLCFCSRYRFIYDRLKIHRPRRLFAYRVGDDGGVNLSALMGGYRLIGRESVLRSFMYLEREVRDITDQLLTLWLSLRDTHLICSSEPEIMKRLISGSQSAVHLRLYEADIRSLPRPGPYLRLIPSSSRTSYELQPSSTLKVTRWPSPRGKLIAISSV